MSIKPMTRIPLAAVLICAGVLCGCQYDQVQEYNDATIELYALRDAANDPTPRNAVAQSFIPSDAILLGVRTNVSARSGVGMNADDGLRLRLHETYIAAPGLGKHAPAGALLGTVDLPANKITFDNAMNDDFLFETPIKLTPGQRYVFVIERLIAADPGVYRLAYGVGQGAGGGYPDRYRNDQAVMLQRTECSGTQMWMYPLADCSGGGDEHLDLQFATMVPSDNLLLLTTAAECFPAGEDEMAVTLAVANPTETIVGGQFLLEYDTDVLEFLSVEPGGLSDTENPFDREIYEVVDPVAGTIDYAVGVNDGETGTDTEAAMAVIRFRILQETCDEAELVRFRTASDRPPTRLSGVAGVEISPTALDLQEITVDWTPPAMDCPTDVTVECDASLESTATGAPVVSDNCDAEPTVAFQDVVIDGVCPDAYSIERTWTASDACGNVTQCLQTITVQDTTPPDLVVPGFVNLPSDKFSYVYNVLPGIVLGQASGVVAVYYNAGTDETPNNIAYVTTQVSVSNVNGAPLDFDDAPLPPYSDTTWSELFEADGEQYGLNLVETMSTWDGVTPPPTFAAVDNADGSCAGASYVGDVDWAIDQYLPTPTDPSACVVNSLLRAASLAANNVTLTTFEMTGGSPPTLKIAGRLLSDSTIHWFDPAAPDSPVSEFQLNGRFYFSGELTEDPLSTAPDDLVKHYTGELTLYANAPTTRVGWALVSDNCDPYPEITFWDEFDPGAGACYSGVITRHWSATDACGNESQADQTINVVPPVCGDMNCDCVVNAFDIDPFVLALVDTDEYYNQYPWCDANRADCNGDNLLNAFDIDPFVLVLVGQ